jgi:hypothetical protein
MTVADESQAVLIPMRRGPVGDNTNQLTLTDGIVTNYVTARPSQALEIIKIPTDVAKAIIGIPATFFTEISTARAAEKQAVNDNKALIESQEALKKAIEELNKKTE